MGDGDVKPPTISPKPNYHAAHHTQLESDKNVECEFYSQMSVYSPHPNTQGEESSTGIQKFWGEGKYVVYREGGMMRKGSYCTRMFSLYGEGEDSGRTDSGHSISLNRTACTEVQPQTKCKN